MEQQLPSTRPTIELNHEHITTLRSLTEDVEIDRELAPVHEQYLAGEYPTTEFGHALVNDLTLSASQIAHLDRQLRANVADLPIDVVQHLTGELDHYHQIEYRQPASPTRPGDDGDDDDIIVADGGRELTPGELAEIYHDEHSNDEFDELVDTAIETVWEDWNDDRYGDVVILESAGWNPDMLRIENTVHEATRSRGLHVLPGPIEFSEPEEDALYDFCNDVVQTMVALADPDEHDVVTDGGVEEMPSTSVEAPSMVADIIHLCEGDRVVFETNWQTFTGEVELTRWETTEGAPDDPGYEVTSAYVALDSDTTPFDGQTAILHAVRPLDGEWRDDEPVVMDSGNMTEDVGQLEELHSVSQSESASRSVSPDAVADLYHYEPDVLDDFASRAAQRVAEQWSEHRRDAVLELIGAGFHPKNISVTSERVAGEWKLAIKHDGSLDGHTVDGFDPEAAQRDFLEDVIAEICDLVRRQVKGARVDSLRGDRR